MKDFKIISALENHNSCDVKKFKSVLEQKYQDPDLSVSSISKEMGMSRFTLIRKVKSMFKLTPVELLRAYRLEKATNIMLQQELSVMDVAYKVGFNDSQYFSRCFKKQYKVSPSNYITE